MQGGHSAGGAPRELREQRGVLKNRVNTELSSAQRRCVRALEGVWLVVQWGLGLGNIFIHSVMCTVN